MLDGDKVERIIIRDEVSGAERSLARAAKAARRRSRSRVQITTMTRPDGHIERRLIRAGSLHAQSVP